MSSVHHFETHIHQRPMAAKRFRVGLAWLGLAWLGLAWLGLAWLGLAWLGLMTIKIIDRHEILERATVCFG